MQVATSAGVARIKTLRLSAFHFLILFAVARVSEAKSGSKMAQ
jgi:hypothetical protein